MVIPPVYSDIGHKFGDAYRSVASRLKPIPTTSTFLTTGTLTPAEFVEAGDQLTFKFPTWKWAPAPDAEKRKDYLPENKQYLITQGVQSVNRVRDLESVLETQTKQDTDWILPPTLQKTGEEPEEEPVPDSTEKIELEGFYVCDEHDLKPPAPEKRSYDVSITFDLYYCVGRIWLMGYDADFNPLPKEAVYEDILAEYVAKTVTFDAHPFTGIYTLSIHPCQHAHMMLRSIEDMQEVNKTPRPDQAMLLFLKFIASVIPTISYDFTMDV